MRKVLLTIILLALVFALAMPVRAAAGYASVTSTGSVAPGETITFTVSISGADPVLSAMITPKYDTAVFEMVGGSFLRSGVMADFNGTDGAIGWAEPTNLNGSILTFTLRAKETAVPGKTYTVSCSLAVRNAEDEMEYGSAGGATVTISCKHSYTVKSTDSKYLCAEATCNTKAKYYVSCANCGAAGTDTFESGELLKHDFTKKNTAAKYAKVASDCKKKGEYYFSCTKCGAKGTTTFMSDTLGEHTYDHGCDTDCNVCGKTRTTSHKYGQEWAGDEKQHWMECQNCKQKDQTADHVPGPEATDTEPQICTVCKKILAPAGNHIHSYPADWSYDEEGHWHACECGSVEDLSAHNWGPAQVVKEATSEEEGISRSVCQICAAEKDEPIEKLPPVQTPSAEPSKVNVPILVLSILLGLSVLANGALLFLLLKKKK